MSSTGPASLGSRCRGARHVASVSADGGALDEPSSASVGEPSTASSSTATRSSLASTASVLASIPAMPPSQLDENYLMGSRAEREQWFPVAFAADLGEGTMIPFDLFNVPWVAFRDDQGRAGCVKDECAHRACPISLGKLVDGKVQCPYHGWEYTTGGECVKMPSIKKLLPDVFVDAAPVVERDGLIRVWTGKWSDDAGAQRDAMRKLDERALAAPDGFATMAEVTVELPMEADEVEANEEPAASDAGGAPQQPPEVGQRRRDTPCLAWTRRLRGCEAARRRFRLPRHRRTGRSAWLS